MHLKIIKSMGLEQKTSCLVLGVVEGKLKTDELQQLDEMVGGAFARAVKAKEFSGQKGETLLLHCAAGGVERVLLCGMGKDKQLTADNLRKTASMAGKILSEKQLDSFVLALAQLPVKKLAFAEKVQAVAEGVLLADYRYVRYLPADRSGQAVQLGKVTLLISSADSKAEAEKAASDAKAIVSSVAFARDLVNAPGNEKSPEFMAMQAVTMAERVGIKVKLLDREQLEKQGFGAMLGVAQGSARDPYLIVLEYCGGTADEKPVALVGKGVVFDTGGISLKPAEKMDEMKMDMGGAAAVLGAIMAAAQLKLPVNLVTVVPAVENMPSGTAIRPGDILTSLAGKTIEVLNTDAEGRLILADALTYVGRFEPRVVIDVATLTGAVIIGLGNHAAAVLGNSDGLARQLIKAGERSGERLWQLPLWEEYGQQIKSDFADVKNTGGRPAGTITAAAFLQKFADDYTWAHLDIAGMAWEGSGKPGQPKGGTGFGVRVLVEYLRALG
ncbi:leucyl aminopeptidase [Malonomonas rubra DSM 5091]|uniref:Probable cytosol aminopeptidase n=1 Tax=Malonomonas rubra DSM 5091 TaxID=1122189 RepID=A0A1M6I6Y8_MALRU|nr:leucyl aminopeptidase [Malonomonas rubra]SHJ30184.1 leucyl aminopeptidase [Malonomonas rubra DSM 5091]